MGNCTLLSEGLQSDARQITLNSYHRFSSFRDPEFRFVYELKSFLSSPKHPTYLSTEQGNHRVPLFLLLYVCFLS